MKFTVIIPARYGSTRFPGKPLVNIDGKPMIQHVVERAQLAQAEAVYVATDDQRIARCVESFGGQVVMTRSDHQSGTERLAEVVQTLQCDPQNIVVNIQGDEPHIPVSVVRQVAQNLADNPEVSMATLACRITDINEFYNPNIVKVVTDTSGKALYFSRSALPFVRDGMLGEQQALSSSEAKVDFAAFPYLRHIGIYAYRAEFIQRYVDMPASPLEQLESLEQLRVLYHGENIHVAEALVTPPPGVDTPEDLTKLMG
ncbi:3-deoxy-manno-octulosonate cytidylyltransferase [Alteromonas sp. LMIT006]|uniref:3-deoxy-manno-octulosonate cytidylyltransferase n=1 Tax=Alteromonadaceae TaxID=72275 RepID=UPI0020CA4057|nr:3-deoxy-manno-octulosonate cytidylyltransferase [Alteromonas sp. LMIT006]UTP72375.1 3-deoxy-manno-octulosonate cytidylyltransferase [Alteromonas sp. LMIT006]